MTIRKRRAPITPALLLVPDAKSTAFWFRVFAGGYSNTTLLNEYDGLVKF
jgi:hypothetical protein